MESGDQILTFVKMFYGSPSTYLWEDELGNSQDIPQGVGGEQGDPLMPLLFAHLSALVTFFKIKEEATKVTKIEQQSAAHRPQTHRFGSGPPPPRLSEAWNHLRPRSTFAPTRRGKKP